MMQAWPALVADLPKITAPLLYFRSTEDHVVDEASQPLITGRVSSRDVTVVPLENSYHVATLDNDAERIFAESADFVARVTAAPEAGCAPGAYARGVQSNPDGPRRPRRRPTTPRTRAWRAIVDNYGDRAEIDEPPPPPPAPPVARRSSTAPFGGRVRRPARRDVRARTSDEPSDADEEGFEPPAAAARCRRLAPDRLARLGRRLRLARRPARRADLLDLAARPGSATCWSSASSAASSTSSARCPAEPRDPWDDGAQV